MTTDPNSYAAKYGPCPKCGESVKITKALHRLTDAGRCEQCGWCWMHEEQPLSPPKTSKEYEVELAFGKHHRNTPEFKAFKAGFLAAKEIIKDADTETSS